jgi:hypothetical protein
MVELATASTADDSVLFLRLAGVNHRITWSPSSTTCIELAKAVADATGLEPSTVKLLGGPLKKALLLSDGSQNGLVYDSGTCMW